MKAEIIAVGTELLLGQTINTDAAYLARKLTNIGVDCYYQQVVGDNAGRLLDAIALATSRSDVIVLSGGLGPTEDDLTKETLAAYLGLPMVTDAPSREALIAHFRRRGYDFTPNNLKQADFPAGTKILPNPRGTAPGCIAQRDGKHYIVLPGPPNEFCYMVDTQVIPYLASLSDERLVTHMLNIIGIGESSLETLLLDLIDTQDRVTIATYAGMGEVHLRLSVKCGRDEDPQPFFDAVEPEIRRRVGANLYGVGDDTLAQATAKLLMEKGKTLSLAESCTGGMIASALVSQPGVSAVLLEGCVCYSNEAKERTLGVRAETLRLHGAVSEETAREMAEGMRRRTGSDYALSVTGIAGPDGGTAEKPVGLVYIALATGSETLVCRLNQPGERQRVREGAAKTALDLLRRELLK